MALPNATARSICVPLPGGGEASLLVRRSRRAQRLALRILPGAGEVELVVPIRATIKQGIAFAREKADWLKSHLGRLPAPVPFEDGAVIPVRDQFVRIRRTDDLFRDVWLVKQDLKVAAPPGVVADDVRLWLLEQARKTLRRHADEKSAILNRQYRRFSVRDTATRWGSCSREGDLSFSWRVIMAPEYVLDYLVSHEVAHLIEMNHSPQFWSIVERLADQPDRGRDWLRVHGADLHRYGVDRRSL